MARNSSIRFVVVAVIIFGCMSFFNGFSFISSLRQEPPVVKEALLQGLHQDPQITIHQDTHIPNDSVTTKALSDPPYIIKVSMLYGEPNEVYEKALQSHIKHGETHGYPVKVLRQKILGRLWTKPAWLLSIVLEELAKPSDQRIEWIFWFDADTFIANPNIPLEIFLPPTPEYDHIHFLCGNDHNGLNDGAFLLKIDDYALHMLAASLSVETYRPEVDLKYSEQSAIEHVVLAGDVYRPWDKKRYIDGYARIPQRWLNAYMGARDDYGVVDKTKKPHANSIREGDLLLHFAGSGITKRERMTKFMNVWDKDKSQWSRSLQDLTLEQDIQKFWKSFTPVQVQEAKPKAI